MKKSLANSKILRFYIRLWGMFFVGILIAILFSNTTSEWRFVALVGFFISIGSFLLVLILLPPVQAEIKNLYLSAANEEERILIGLFYFSRAIFFLLGLFILAQSLLYKSIQEKDLVEISGKITSIDLVDESSLKISFENNSNQFGTRTFKVPDENLQKIENGLKPGDIVFVLIEYNDKDIVNDSYVQIYGIRTDTIYYLTLEEYNTADSVNNLFGYMLGVLFTGVGLIYLFTGRISRGVS